MTTVSCGKESVRRGLRSALPTGCRGFQGVHRSALPTGTEAQEVHRSALPTASGFQASSNRSTRLTGRG